MLSRQVKEVSKVQPTKGIDAQTLHHACINSRIVVLYRIVENDTGIYSLMPMDGPPRTFNSCLILAALNVTQLGPRWVGDYGYDPTVVLNIVS